MSWVSLVLIRPKFMIVKGCFRRYFSSRGKIGDSSLEKIRNIGILAHIDAGKTTTTERMLYYSGLINAMGEVHHGNTVTDYMDQERARGITITSAAVSFSWCGHRINLVDTPGHIDFTMEVEQTLQVLDGAIVILDASAGVEAQTLTVWKQADHYSIPRIVFLNKMDRKDADLKLCVDSITSKFPEVIPLLCQIPLKDSAKNLIGIIDLPSMMKLTWDQKALSQKDHGELWENANEARNNLVEKLADLDDSIAEKVIMDENIASISGETILKSIKNATITQKGVPILCGSSYRNTGVQPLMDAVLHFLPSPSERLWTEFESNLCRSFADNFYAKAFKIIHDKQRGPLTFVRIYSGTFKKGQKIYNLRSQKSEVASKLMIATADDYEDVENVETGNIAVVSGLKETVAGDVITNGTSAAKAAKSYLMKKKGMSEEEVDSAFSKGANAPDPVFYCSVEPSTQAYQNALDRALNELAREDPSLKVSVDNETGQTVLGGMGELHLEIIKERLVSDYKVEVDLGPLQIAYKENPISDCKDSFEFTHKIGSTTHEVKLTISLTANESPVEKEGKSKSVPLVLDKSPESASNIAAVTLKQLQAVRQGVEIALSNGPKLGCPVINTEVTLHWLEVRRGTSETILASSVTNAIQR
ncbi:hypothetical protein J437_LFUL002140, partial [Ladona fulva]